MFENILEKKLVWIFRAKYCGGCSFQMFGCTLSVQNVLKSRLFAITFWQNFNRLVSAKMQLFYARNY